uniref:Ig-like domain-containing protein n=1 Tax=Salarias fasciatus TaxID=181472 RepID=A0A672H6Q3_SALFA
MLFSLCKGEDKVMQPSGDVPAAEGDSVTLNCTFETSYPNPYLFWYKQSVNSYPEYILNLFLISHLGSGSVINNPVPGLKIKVTEKQIHLMISSAAVSDSAVYYCAVRELPGERL